ncbi:MAG: TIGR03668 family PPOX class F420-dependent oxidoreductase [Candidatus Limnocylindrales bacterium]
MPILSADHIAFLAATRRAILATIAPSGVPRQVPICFAVVDAGDGNVLYSPLDEKPKRGSDPHGLARVRDLLARPQVSLLADRWEEDWASLAWLRVEATASLVEAGGPEHARAIGALRSRYRQYRAHALEACPLIRLEPTRTVWWSASAVVAVVPE